MNRETAVLQLMHTPGIGTKRLSRLLARLNAENYPVEDFVVTPTKELTEEYGLTLEMTSSLKDMVAKVGEVLEELWKHEIRMVVQHDHTYPNSLRNILEDNAPPVLFVKGNLEILNKRSVGICGSRKASEKGCELVRNSAGLLAKSDINVISGYAHGIDLAAHIGSLETGGVTTFVLPLGILNFQLKSSINSLLSGDNYLVISEFLPKLGWEIHNAMRRNLTICGLSKAIILVEPGMTGGTFEAGKTALKYERPLFVVEHDEQSYCEGYKYFLQRGARSIVENSSGVLELDEIIEVVNSEIPQAKQQSLF